jgi:hypothetical protein
MQDDSLCCGLVDDLVWEHEAPCVSDEMPAGLLNTSDTAVDFGEVEIPGKVRAGLSRNL